MREEFFLVVMVVAFVVIGVVFGVNILDVMATAPFILRPLFWVCAGAYGLLSAEIAYLAVMAWREVGR